MFVLKSKIYVQYNPTVTANFMVMASEILLILLLLRNTCIVPELLEIQIELCKTNREVQVSLHTWCQLNGVEHEDLAREYILDMKIGQLIC